MKPGGVAQRLSYTEWSGGWAILVSDDFAWAYEQRVWELSHFGLTLGCQFRDDVDPTAFACAAEKRRLLWSVSAEGSEMRRLRISGEPPAGPAVICGRLLQRSGKQTWASIMLQAPVELAMLVCGYRTDAAAAASP